MLPSDGVRFFSVVLLLAAVDLLSKFAASRWLKEVVDLFLLELRVGYNSGVAFSLGDRLPSAVVLAGTALATIGLGVYAITCDPRLNRWSLWGFALVLSGAVGNVADRAQDGLVTDFLYTGWFPTFNLADVFITAGAAMILGGSLGRTTDTDRLPSSDPSSRQ